MVALLLACVIQGEELRWFSTNDWEAAAAESTKSKKRILAYFHEPSCEECKTLQQEAFSDPGVIKIAEAGFVSLRVDVAKQPELAARFANSRHHAFALLMPPGGEVAGIPAYSGPARLARALKKVAAGLKVWDDLRGRASLTEAEQLQIASAHVDLGRWDLAVDAILEGRKSKNPEVHALIGLTFARTSAASPEAVRRLDLCIENAARDKSVFLGHMLHCRFDLVSELRDVGEQLRTCDAALFALPEDEDADLWHLRRVRALGDLERFKEAAKAGEKALKDLGEKAWTRSSIERETKSNSKIAAALDTLASSKGDREAATAACREVLVLLTESRRRSTLVKFARAMIEAGADEPEALGKAFYAVATDPGTAQADSTAAWTLGLKADPENKSGHLDYFLLRRAQHELSKNDMSAAIATAKRALEIAATSPHAAALYYVIGGAHLRLGDKELATAAIQSALERNPSEALRQALLKLKERAQK